MPGSPPISTAGARLRYDVVDRPPEEQWGHALPDWYCRHPKLAIFCDSEQFHSSAEARARDHGVSVALHLQGITALRFTGTQILKSPKLVECMIREAFDAGISPDNPPMYRRDAA